MSSYCASCLADLALVRDAVTSVNGTAACVAHAVLLTHPGDTPQRRLQRLTELRSMAEGKLATASADDIPAIELLVQEYALAGAMDMTVPLRDIAGDRGPRPPKKRRERDRGRDRDRGPREFPVETRTADGDPSGDAATPSGAATSGELSGAEGAPATSRPDDSATTGAASDLSGAEGAPATPRPDSSQEAPVSAAPVLDTSQEPASREPHPSPEPAPHGDGLLAPEGVNSSSTTAQQAPDVADRPSEAPVGE